MPSISISQMSPSRIHTGGLRAWPTPGGRAHRDHVAGLERHDLGQDLDGARHVEDHVAGGRGLHDLAVETAFDVQIGRAGGQLVRRHQDRARSTPVASKFLPASIGRERRW